MCHYCGPDPFKNQKLASGWIKISDSPRIVLIYNYTSEVSNASASIKGFDAKAEKSTLNELILNNLIYISKVTATCPTLMQ